MLRKLIKELLRTDSDLEAFCSDYFPEVAERFTNGMDRIAKVTLLLDHGKPARVLDALQETNPEAAPAIDEILKAHPEELGLPEKPCRLPPPELPPHFIARLDEIESLKRLVLEPAHSPVAVTGRAARTGVQGMGGIGKTVLAASLARDDDVRRAFPDGIFWITLGQHPPLTQRQAELAAALGEPGEMFQEPQEGKARLTELLAHRGCLLILDDAWHIDHVTAFGATGSRGRVLFTTRDASIAAGLGAQTNPLDLLSDEQALTLLADWSGQPFDALPPEARLVAGECGNLPLALAMAGACVHGQPEAWKDALEMLRAADLETIAQKLPDYPYPTLLRAIQVSIDALAPEQRARYLDFAVFPEDTPIPRTVLQVLWKSRGLKEYQTGRLLHTFVSRSLIRREEGERFLLHDLQRDYVISHVGDLPSLHNRLLDAYAECCPNGWASGPQDGYFFQHLPYHLAAAGRRSELRRLLLGFEWLRAKLRAAGLDALLADFDRLRGDPSLALVEGALRLSAYVLTSDGEQLASQLIGRLFDECDPEIEALLSAIAASQTGPWLRPLAGGLAWPGGPTLRTLHWAADFAPPEGWFEADPRWNVYLDPTLKFLADLKSERKRHPRPTHWGGAEALAVTADGRWAVCSSSGGRLSVWDLHSRQAVRSFSANTSSVRALAITPDGRRAIAGSEDKTIRVWNLQTAMVESTLAGHSDRVRALAVTADGQRLISGSKDKTLKLWDLQAAREVLALSGHSDGVNAVAVTADGRWAISGSDDKTVMVWDLQAARAVHTLSGHSDRVRAVAVTEDGHWAVSASFDDRLKVWDIRQGREVHTLSGHSSWVTATRVVAGGRVALSGSNDMTLKAWDLPSGSLLATFTAENPIEAVAASSDGRWIVAGDQSALYWLRLEGI